MATAALQNGKLVWVEQNGKRTWWEPTTELLCSFCREPFMVIPQTLGKVNFTFELCIPGPLDHGEYWYLHKRCAFIDRTLERRWGWLSLYPILGLGYDGKPRNSKIQKELQERLPPGVYEQLYAQWLPAVKPQKTPPVRLKFGKDVWIGDSNRLVRVTGKKSKELSQPARDARPVSLRREPKPPPLPIGKPGYVYLIEAVGSNRIKIGHGQNAVVRWQQLSTGSPFPLRLIRSIPTVNSLALEQRLHRRYDAYNVHNEWFVLPPDLLAALLEEKFS